MDYSKLKPLHGIIVLKLATTDTSDGGIILVEEKRLDHAEVVAIGPGEWVKEPNKPPYFREVGVKVGDTVVVAPGAGVILDTEIDGEEEMLTYVSEFDIVAIKRV